ncbi:hypothetical protein F383_26139 [Gossypium arboreum]|uniref:Uncharacterized protein n=1 Tax=Gossypium arboreum TaxID=29729 RepID=A0A0B0P2W5_GOSAR|nr:hypothetical protein F383_26139 [Gossypium arboreum]
MILGLCVSQCKTMFGTWHRHCYES